METNLRAKTSVNAPGNSENKEFSKQVHSFQTVLPGDPLEPCPELLTEDEAVRFLRLDVDGPKNTSETMRYYRSKGLLLGTRVGKHIRYMRTELIQFLLRQTYGADSAVQLRVA